MSQQERGRRARVRILELLQKREGYSKMTKPPTVREVAAAIGLSVAATHRHIEILTERGLIAPRPARKARTIRLGDDD